MQFGLHVLYDYFSHPLFELTHTKVPHVLEIWNPLRGFVFSALLLMAWLFFWAFHGSRRSRAKPLAQQPAPLRVSEHANHLGVKEEELAQWRTYRIAIVAFSEDNRLARVSQLDSIGTAAAAGSRG